jgi:hypothetical protein
VDDLAGGQPPSRVRLAGRTGPSGCPVSLVPAPAPLDGPVARCDRRRQRRGQNSQLTVPATRRQGQSSTVLHLDRWQRRRRLRSPVSQRRVRGAAHDRDENQA